MLEQFMNMLASRSTVFRDGKMVQIDASQLVVGDVVLVRMGDKVPADVFIFAGEIKVRKEEAELSHFGFGSHVHDLFRSITAP